jgi:hypothetical protein
VRRLARAWRFGSARDRRIALERHVRAILVVIGELLSHQAEQMPLPKDNHMIEQLAA